MSFYIKGNEVENATSYELYEKGSGEILYNATEIPGKITTNACFLHDKIQAGFRNRYISEIRLCGVGTANVKIIKKSNVANLAAASYVGELDATVLKEVLIVPGWNSIKFDTPIILGDNEFLGTYDENAVIGYDNQKGIWGLHCWNNGEKKWKTYTRTSGQLFTIAMVVIETDQYIPIATSDSLNFDMTVPDNSGRHTYAVRAKGPGYTDSILSNRVDYDTYQPIAVGTVDNGRWIHNNTGEYGSNITTSWTTTDFIAVPAGAKTIYTPDITVFRSSTTDTITAPFGFYDKDKNFIVGISEDVIPRTSGGQWRGVVDAEIPENAAYVRICWTITAYTHNVSGVNTQLVQPDVYWGY